MFLLAAWVQISGRGLVWILRISEIYPGYDVTLLGIIFGLIYGFVDGFILGWVVAWLYNKFQD